MHMDAAEMGESPLKQLGLVATGTRQSTLEQRAGAGKLHGRRTGAGVACGVTGPRARMASECATHQASGGTFARLQRPSGVLRWVAGGGG